MPLIRIHALPPKAGEGDFISSMLASVCDRVADTLRCDRRHVWATFQPIEPGAYVEGGQPRPPNEQPHSTHPPIAELLAFEGRSGGDIAAALEAIADTLTESLGLERGNAFVYCTTLVSGGVYTGGQVRTR